MEALAKYVAEERTKINKGLTLTTGHQIDEEKISKLCNLLMSFLLCERKAVIIT